MATVFPSIYRAKATRWDGTALTVLVPQIFGEAPVAITDFTGSPTTGMGWVAFQGGNPEFPVWISPGAGGAATPTAAVGSATTAEFIRDTIGATLVPGPNMTITVDDIGNTITLSPGVSSTTPLNGGNAATPAPGDPVDGGSVYGPGTDEDFDGGNAGSRWVTSSLDGGTAGLVAPGAAVNGGTVHSGGTPVDFNSDIGA